MDIKLLNRQNLRPLLKLLDKRDKLQEMLDKVHAQIEAAFHGAVAAPAAKARRGRKPQAASVPHEAKGGARKRAPRGSIKKKILAELKAAGAAGASAKELAAKLKVPNQNIHVWFNSTGNKMKEIKKVGRGHWVLTES